MRGYTITITITTGYLVRRLQLDRRRITKSTNTFSESVNVRGLKKESLQGTLENRCGTHKF